MIHIKWYHQLIVLCVMLYSAGLAREKVHIDQILDCNRFLLKDGRTIQLVNVETPSRADTSGFNKQVIRQILDYMKKEVCRTSLYMEIADTLKKKNVYRVHLFQKFDLNSVNVNQGFLSRGFGFYQPEPSTDYSEIYFQAAQTAYQKNLGLWMAKKSLAIRRPAENYSRLRFCLGLIDLFEENHRNNEAVFLSVGYRISKLLPFYQKNRSYISLSAGFDSYYFYIHHLYFGLEIRLKHSYSLSVNKGGLALLFQRNGFLSGNMWDVNAGYLFPSANVEFEVGYVHLNDEDRILRFSLCLNNLYR